MQIKRIELNGFKSFSNKTVIEIQDGITGVVGPNGCGKSNIVDAIRWAMGETSAKHLRGKSMEDVIFSGSSKRAPTNVAEVSLVLSTSDGLAPAQYINFSEIVVTRRLYRSGESEYLINKTKCRLKDIYDVFLGSGVGTKAYSIIEQGQISRIIMSKPEDRRVIIEEAANISKFKSRKDAALRKIEHTQANLLRLSDILAELKKQIASLDRQARKAERYKVIKEEAKEIELHLSSMDYLDQMLRLKENEGRMAAEKEAELICAARLDEFDAKQSEMRLKLSEDETRLMDLQERLFEKNNQIQLAQTNIEYKSKEQARLESESQHAKELIEENKKLLLDLEQRLSEIGSSKLGSTEVFTSFAGEVSTLEQELHDELRKEKEHKQSLEQFQSELLQLTQDISRQQSRKEDLSRRKTELSERVEKYQSEIDEIDHQVASMKKKQRSSDVALSDLKQFKLDLGKKVQDLEVQLALLLEDSKVKEQELEEQGKELSFKESRLKSLEDLAAKFEGFGEGVRTILTHKGEIDSSGSIHGIIADVMDTESEYEAAVGAVLGEKLQYVVVNDKDAGVTALQYLKNQSKGRSSFIPIELSALPLGEVTTPLSGEGLIGPLKKFIRMKSAYEGIGEFLFGDVYLVKTLDHALKIWNDSPIKNTLVTLDGEVIDHFGIVTGGVKEDHNRSVFEQKREIKSLKADIQILTSDLGLKKEIFGKVKVRIKNLQDEIEGRKRDTHDEEIKIVHHEKDLVHLDNELKKLTGRRDKLSIEISAWVSEQSELENEIHRCGEGSSDLADKKSFIENQIQNIKDDLEARSQGVEALQGSLLDKKIKLANLEEKKQNLEKEYARFCEEKDQKIRLLDEKDRFITQSGETLVEIQGELQSLKANLDGNLASIGELSEKTQSLKEEFQSESQNVQERELELKKLREELNQLKDHLSSSFVQVSEGRSQVQLLKSQIFERYHLDLASVASQYQDKEIDVQVQRPHLAELKSKLEKMGSVNLSAIEEYDELKERYDFLSKQHDDLYASIDSLNKAITKINRTTKKRFRETFDAVNKQFKETFPRLFKGGKGELRLTDEADLLNTGVDIIAQPPGKKMTSISLMSGGEKALTAISLLFSVFLIKPSPFCILDEVDAPLDDANIDRFNDIVSQMVSRSQFILITHNKRTMEIADTLYGITMEEPGCSKLVSVKLNENAGQVNVA